MNYNSDVEAVDAFSNKYKTLKKEISKIIVGQDEAVSFVLTSIFCNGHSLLIGVPGLAKTLLVNTISQVLELDFQRVQFTPDLMPSDIIGAEILDENKKFKFNKGPIFSNIVLADEINRTPPKTQAALLEAMQERHVTVSGEKHLLPKPFFVLATQNPIEQEGTYRLPEAQLDRFLFKINVDYPNADEELEIIMREQALENTTKVGKIETIIEGAKILEYRSLVNQIKIEENLLKYIANIVVNTRSNSFLYLGASPRASIAILNASKAFAAIEGRDFVTPEDIKRATIPVLQHRVIVTPEREMEGLTSKQIIEQIIEAVEIPR